MKWDDLLKVPYLVNGRTLAGMDCYGLVIECFRRDGKTLKDLTLSLGAPMAEHIKTINVHRVDGPYEGVGVQFILDNRLHIGYMMNRREVLHMTKTGVRLTPLFALVRGNPRFFEVIV